jgi:hypothetical protein
MQTSGEWRREKADVRLYRHCEPPGRAHARPMARNDDFAVRGRLKSAVAEG